MNKLKSSNLLYIVFIFSGLLSSCVSTKDLKYFQNISDSTQLNSIALPQYHEPVIHPFDVLSVSIQTSDADPKLTAGINTPVASSSSTSTSGADLSGYMVDSTGYIQMPILGLIKVGGMGIPQATQAVIDKAKVYFKDPIVIVKNKSFRVTVIGEVAAPGVKYISTPKASVLDLLGLTGDMTLYAQRHSVLLLRQNDNNTLSTIRLDFTNTNLLKSQYYYLRSNDVIIVEPNKQKAIASDVTFTRNLGFVTLGLSLFSTFLFLFRN